MSSKHPALAKTEHRPWPLPEKPWLLQQVWSRLLFLHYEADLDDLRKRIPKPLEIDTFDGKPWLAIVPFSMEEVAPRGFPKPKSISNFPEINIRSYVTYEGKPGVWFNSLDVPNRLPVWLARTFFHLPYFRAKMRVTHDSGETSYQSNHPERSFSARFRGHEPITPAPDSFAHWATERYCFYTSNARGQILRAEVQHPKWSLQRASCDIETNTMLRNFKTGPQHPDVLYCEKLPVVAWWPEKRPTPPQT